MAHVPTAPNITVSFSCAPLFQTLTEYAGELCNKQYTRMEELDRHENSETHMHALRRQDLHKAHSARIAKRVRPDVNAEMRPLKIPKRAAKPKSKGQFVFSKPNPTGDGYIVSDTVNPVDGDPTAAVVSIDASTAVPQRQEHDARLEAKVPMPAIPAPVVPAPAFDWVGPDFNDSEDELFGHFDPRHPDPRDVDAMQSIAPSIREVVINDAFS